MKQFKLINLIVLLFLGLSISSCLDIEEEYHFNKDGSGYSVTRFNVSKMMEMMKMFGGMMDSTGTGGMDQLKDMFTDNTMVTALQRIPGISNVKDLNDEENAIIGFSYEFANLEALNAVMKQSASNNSLSSAMGMEMEADADTEKGITLKGKKFQLIHGVDRMDEMIAKKEGGDESMEMAKMMFAEANYTVSLHFDRNVKKVSNEKGEINSDGKTVTITQSLQDLMSGEGNLSCKVKLK